MASNTVTNMRKTILCRSVTEGGGRGMGGGCRYAHTIEELYPKLCKYGSKCNRHKDHPVTCLFVHPDEDIFDYATTHGFVSQPGSRPPPIVRVDKIGRFENRVQHTDPVRKQIDFSLSTDDWPDLSCIAPPSSPHEFDNEIGSPLAMSDLEIGSPLAMSDLEMGNLSGLDDSLHNDWPLPLVFSSKPSPLQRQTSTMYKK